MLRKQAGCLVLTVVIVIQAKLGFAKTSEASALGKLCSVVRSEILNEYEEKVIEPRGQNCTYYSTQFIDSNRDEVSRVQDLLVKMGNQSDFFAQDLEVFTNLEVLEIIGEGPLNLHRATSSLSIGSITVSGKQLQNVTEVTNVFPDVTKLLLSEDSITSLGETDVTDMTSLESLIVERSSLSKVELTWLNRSTNLRRLELRDVKLTEISTDFKKAKYLEFLDLSNNHITIIHNFAFTKAAEMTTLILSNNLVQTIERKAFKGLYNLEWLDLSENRITRLPSGVFEHILTHDLTLNFWENPINCDCDLAWVFPWFKMRLRQSGSSVNMRLRCSAPSQNNGKMLHADHSGLQPNELGECGENTETSGAAAIPPDTTSYICPTHCGCFTSRVEYKAANSHPAPDYSFPLTSCMGNNNTELPTNIDARTHCLVSTNGLLEVLNVDELDHIEGLVSLDLKQNRISTLTGNHVFQSLTVLSLEHNLLTSITKRFLRNFPMLRKLRIYNNQIQYLAPRLFLYNRLLTKLFIGPNPLGGSFQGECFDNLQLINLGLQKVGLTSVPAGIRHMSNLLKLDLSDNFITKINKDDFANCFSLGSITLENNNLTRIVPGAFRNTGKLEVLDLSENRLTTIENGTFKALGPSITHMELWQNPFKCDCKLTWFVNWISKDLENPLADVRFRCETPSRMNGKTSSQTSIEQFTCGEDDTPGPELVACPNSQSSHYTVVAVIITILCCCVLLALVYILKRRCRTDRSRGSNCIKLGVKKSGNNIYSRAGFHRSDTDAIYTEEEILDS